MAKLMCNYPILECSFFGGKHRVEMTGIERGGVRSTNLYSVVTDGKDDTEAVYNDGVEACVEALERIIQEVNETSSQYGVRFILQVIDEGEDEGENESE